MKRVLVIMPVLLLLVQCVFAQINTYPWTEDFESNSFATNGWTSSIISGSAEWGLGTGDTHSAVASAHSGTTNAIISNNEYEGDTALLLSPVFARPCGDGTIKISFYYASPDWSGDFDELIVKYIDAENSSTLLTIAEITYEWTLATIDLPVSSLAGTFQIGFVGVPKYGYGLLLDDVTLDFEESTVVVDTYPWSEDFESGSFDANGCTTSILSGTASWTIATGSTHGGDVTAAHSGSYNAEISNERRVEDTAVILSPIFVRPADIDTLELSFFYANPDWGGDYDRMIVRLVNCTDETELCKIENYHNGWVKMEILLTVSDLPENFQIAFVGIPKYGYGFLLDDIEMKEYEPIINFVETDSYRQVGLDEELGAFPVNTSYGYGYSQQIFNSTEMGGRKTIYSLSFNYSGNETEETSRQVKVYMGHTQKSEFLYSGDFVPATEMTKVFSGIMTIPAESSWATIVLETPFVYNGTDNLVLAVYDLSGNSVSERTFYCSGTELAQNISYVDNSLFGLNTYMYGSRSYKRNNVRFGLENIEPTEPEIDVVNTDSYRQVGTDVSHGRSGLPLTADNNWSLSQQIFTSAEMGGARTIYSLAFNCLENTNGNILRNVKIYLAHTAKGEFDFLDSDVIDLQDMTKVYSGQMSFDAESGWISVVLDSPFQYNGNDNLVVAVVDMTNASTENPISFACSNLTNTRSVFFSNYEPVNTDNLSYVDYRELCSYRSNIRFGIESVEPVHQDVDTDETAAYLQVGTETSQNSNVLPIKTDIMWSYSQQIFTAEEMGGSRTIYTLAFNYSGNTNNELTRSIKIYLANTQNDEFDFAGEDFIDVDNLTKVYSGRISFEAESGWATVVLNTPFVYNGTDNLVVAVVDNSGNYASPVSFVCTGITKSRAAAVYEDYSASIDNTSDLSYRNLCYFRNNIRFGLEYVEPPAHIVDTVETASYLQVGTGTVQYSLPLNTYYGYSYSQQVFASWEMGGERDIYTVSFNYTGNTYGNVERNTKLYMGHTDKYEFDYRTDWVASSDVFNVCSSDIHIDEESGWITFVLRAPFHYNGTDNLVVAVRDNTGDYIDGSIKFMCSESEYFSSIYEFNDSRAEYNFDTYYGLTISKRSNIRFGLEYVEPPAVDVDTLEADNYLQVGTGTSVREALPMNTAGKYSYSQQIFNSAEMGGAKTIYSLSFNCVTNDNVEALRNVRIYMGNTNAFEFEYNNWVNVLNHEVDSGNGTVSQVYSGELTIPATSSLITVIFDQPFEYDGTSNLVLAWLDNTGTAQTFKRFACTESILGNSIMAVSNMNPIDLDHTERLVGVVMQSRNNIRFGTESLTAYNLEVASEDPVMGTVSGSGRYEGGSVVSVCATAYPCFEFSEWSDGITTNPRQITLTEDITLTAKFKSIDNDTLNYDNDIYNVSLGYNNQNVEWGILLLPQHIANRPYLTDVMFYVDGQYSYGEYKLNIYQGADTIPAESMYRDSISVAEGTEGWLNFGFDTLNIDRTKPLWVILSCEGEYPAVASSFNGEGYKNGAWWNPNGTWTQQNHGAWMIKAIMPIVEEGNEVELFSTDNISIYPNPVSSHLYIEGVADGEMIEIYNIAGVLVANFMYRGDVVDVESLPAGMYILRSNGSVAKFIKE